MNASRLFTASRIAVGTTAARFAIITTIMGPLKDSFSLTNEQVGWIGGAGLWGFTITMLVFGSFCDLFGMRLILRLAFLAHLGGAVMMLSSSGFFGLFFGSLLLSMADGLVQAAVNPLTVTLFPDRKTDMVNKLHLWFPAGIVICGLASYALDNVGWDMWQLKLGMVFVPTAAYGILFVAQSFPVTERVQLGVSFGQMCRETLLRPMFYLLTFCMMMTASVELAPNTWVTSVLESNGIPGILILVWISLLMALARQFAGPMIRKVSSPGILVGSSVLSGLGLVALSCAGSLESALAAGTIFAAGVAYFWPTMIGITSERVPKGGALALSLVGAAGTLAVGLVAVPMMGRIADVRIPDRLPVTETAAHLQRIAETYPALAANASEDRLSDLERAAKAAAAALGRIEAGEAAVVGAPEIAALRSAITAAPDSEAGKAAKSLLSPAENYGGRMAFRSMALLSVLLTVIFAGIFLRDRLGSPRASADGAEKPA